MQSSQNIVKVDDNAGEIYFTASSSASTLEKISYKTAANPTIIMSEGIKVDWLKLDFIGDDLYFFATNDSNYLHTINIKTFDKNAKDEDGNLIGSTYVGFEREEDEEE